MTDQPVTDLWLACARLELAGRKQEASVMFASAMHAQRLPNGRPSSASSSLDEKSHTLWLDDANGAETNVEGP